MGSLAPNIVPCTRGEVLTDYIQSQFIEHLPCVPGYVLEAGDE